MFKKNTFYKNADIFPTIIQICNVLYSSESGCKVEFCFWYECQNGNIYQINQDPVIDYISKGDYKNWTKIDTLGGNNDKNA